jgi:glutamate--cysteine ligase catalytic subunit
MFNVRQANGFVGLLPLIWAYIEAKGADKETKDKLRAYLDVVKGRASGELKTTATWIREFIRSHPAYKFDSAVSEEITYDLMVAIDELCFCDENLSLTFILCIYAHVCFTFS